MLCTALLALGYEPKSLPRKPPAITIVLDVAGSMVSLNVALTSLERAAIECDVGEVLERVGCACRFAAQTRLSAANTKDRTNSGDIVLLRSTTSPIPDKV